MFISLIGEFVLGYFANGCILRIDSAVILISLGSTLISELTRGSGELTELQADEVDEILISLESELESVTTFLSFISEVVFAGQSSETFTAVLEIVATLSDAVSLFADYIAISTRGLNSLALVGEDNRTISCGLLPLEIISSILRPLSLALRIFANLTSGILISSLSGSAELNQAVSDLTTTTFGSNGIGVFIALSILLSAFETVVGIIQSFVYFILATQYSRIIRN